MTDAATLRPSSGSFSRPSSPGLRAPNDERTALMGRIETLERVLERQFRLPVVGDVGLDGVIGLIPGVGDAATAAISGYLMLEARKAGARRRTLARMAANVGIDLVLGLMPIIGDIADFFHKSNSKNLRLLKRELQRQPRQLQGTSMSDSIKSDQDPRPEPEGKRLGHRSPDNSTPPADQHREGHSSDHRAAAAPLSADEETGVQAIPHPVKGGAEPVHDKADELKGGVDRSRETSADHSPRSHASD